MSNDLTGLDPVVAAADVSPGVHVTSIGFAPPGGELDPDSGRVRPSVRRDPPGLRAAARGPSRARGLDLLVTELGDVLAGRAPGRSHDDEITVYKAMGHIAEDAAAAELVYRAALDAGVGRDVDLFLSRVERSIEGEAGSTSPPRARVD